IPPEQRSRYQAAFEKRAAELVKSAAADGDASQKGFSELIGLGDKGPLPFDALPFTHNEADFDESGIPTQLHSAAEVYYILQHEQMKVFQVAWVLLRLFHEGRMRVQRGPGARALYLLEKHYPLRYKARDRMLAYRRAFGSGPLAPPPGAVVYDGFN